MKKYLKAYTLGILFTLIFVVVPVLFMTTVPFSFKKHWIAIVIFLPTIIYFAFSTSDYLNFSLKKENIKKSAFFISGAFFSALGIVIILET